jgi:hypothetical protein
MSAEDPSIAELAYRLWESRGRPADSADRDWLEAEARLAKASAEPKASEGRRKPRASRAPKAAATRKPGLPAETSPSTAASLSADESAAAPGTQRTSKTL